MSLNIKTVNGRNIVAGSSQSGGGESLPTPTDKDNLLISTEDEWVQGNIYTSTLPSYTTQEYLQYESTIPTGQRFIITDGEYGLYIKTEDGEQRIAGKEEPFPIPSSNGNILIVENGQWTQKALSQVETDPTVPSYVKNITQADIDKWNEGIGELPIASVTQLGGVKIGSGITVTEDGTISAQGGEGNLPTPTDENNILYSTTTEWLQGNIYETTVPAYTQEEFNRIKDTIPIGQRFIITDDYQQGGGGSLPTPTIENDGILISENSEWIQKSISDCETDPTVPSYVKAITQADINKWNQGGSSGTILLSQQYTTSEKLVGRWTDGKPLYQKTVHIANCSIGNHAHNIENIDAIVGYESFFRNSQSTFNLPYVNSYEIYNSDEIAVNKTNIVIAGNLDLSAYMADVTIKYTKTTDTSESIPPIIAQDLMNQIFTTQEREVGRWIDGKPLYQKTIEYNNTINPSDLRVIFSDANIDFLKVITITGVDTTEIGYTLPYTFGTQSWRVLIDNTNIWVSSGKGVAIQGTNNPPTLTKVVLTVQYTKVTDNTTPLPLTSVSSDEYSADETLIGKWVDEKPLYQKTFILTSFTYNTVTAIDVANNIDNIWLKDDGTFFTTYYNNKPYYTIKPLSFPKVANEPFNLNTLRDNSSDVGRFQYQLESGYEGKMYVTVQYTKTTD